VEQGQRGIVWGEALDAFVKLPQVEQKRRATALGLTREGDEKRTNMTELCLWFIRAAEAGTENALLGIQ
jgi:hypothetical protein